MDFVVGLPKTTKGHDAIWVVVDRLTKSAHFISIKTTFSLEQLANFVQRAMGTTLNFSTAFHPQTDGQSERTIQILEDMLRACVLDFKGTWNRYLPLIEFSYNNSYQATIGMAPYEALPLEFEIGEKVFLKIAPMKGVLRFGKKGKLSPRFIGPYEILERVGKVAYRLALPPDLSKVHNVFHVSMLKKYISDPTHILQSEPIQVNEDLTYEEKPVQILDRKEKELRKRKIPLVKVLWRNHATEEATWEREDEMRSKHPELF
ncbi:hypothetical protein UlMin_031807 [Ulmus minor]